jgi:NAD(P)-dependent dehydrogenase (short-subunit alcohol dehydrogenase family)
MSGTTPASHRNGHQLTNRPLKGKVVVVTGASGGIGRTLAIRAAVHGAEAVIAADIRETPREGGDRTRDTIRHLGVTARFVATDVSQASHVDRLMSIAGLHGGVDVLVCDADAPHSYHGPDVSEYGSDQLSTAHVTGVLHTVQAAARQMGKLGKTGSIVLVSGVVGADSRVTHYTVKGAVTSMTKALADAHGPRGIRVNAVAPDAIDITLLRSRPDTVATAERLARRAPLGRLGAPSEVADAVAYLGSDLSSYVTGTVLVVDGGLSATV